MATTQDTRTCALCEFELPAGTGTSSINAGTHYLCTQCAASADRAFTEGTRTSTPTN